MTTVITRLYADRPAAEAVERSLAAQGFDAMLVDVVCDGPDVEGRIVAGRVGGKLASVLAGHVRSGAALLIVRAPFTPFGAARRAFAICDARPVIEAENAAASAYIRETPSRRFFKPSVLTNHPRFLSGDLGPGSSAGSRLFSSLFGAPTILRGRRPLSIRRGGPATAWIASLLTRRRDPV